MLEDMLEEAAVLILRDACFVGYLGRDDDDPRSWDEVNRQDSTPARL